MKKIKSLLFFFLFLSASLLNAAPVNINTADAETLARELNGIGHSKAEAIVAYRKLHGPYRQVEDLGNVKGIGIATIDRNRPNLTIE